MDEVQLKKLLSEAVAFAEEYQVQWKELADLDSQRQLLDVEEYGITSTCQIREKLFTVDKEGALREVDIARRTVRKKHYGEAKNVDTVGEPVSQTLTGSEAVVIIVHSSFLTQPQGPHDLKRILEAYSSKQQG